MPSVGPTADALPLPRPSLPGRFCRPPVLSPSLLLGAPSTCHPAPPLCHKRLLSATSECHSVPLSPESEPEAPAVPVLGPSHLGTLATPATPFPQTPFTTSTQPSAVPPASAAHPQGSQRELTKPRIHQEGPSQSWVLPSQLGRLDRGPPKATVLEYRAPPHPWGWCPSSLFADAQPLPPVPPMLNWQDPTAICGARWGTQIALTRLTELLAQSSGGLSLCSESPCPPPEPPSPTLLEPPPPHSTFLQEATLLPPGPASPQPFPHPWAPVLSPCLVCHPQARSSARAGTGSGSPRNVC